MSPAAHRLARPDVTYDFDLGPWTRKVSTSSDACQRWFDRGLNWTYGFNHEEAVACFRRAASEDPSCAMAWWGVAYANGPFYLCQRIALRSWSASREMLSDALNPLRVVRISSNTSLRSLRRRSRLVSTSFG